MHGKNIVPRVVKIEISASYDSRYLICTKSTEYSETGNMSRSYDRAEIHKYDKSMNVIID
jgi:ribosomal protein L33